ncbi:MAG TPA: hypothetical protein V6C78_27660 [Crinalium sp.]
MSVQKPDLQAKRELGQGAGVEPLAGGTASTSPTLIGPTVAYS